MVTETPLRPVNAPGAASHSDEYFLQHSLVFAESLKDLKNLRIQLYSAAEYFESSYKKHEYKQLVLETAKDFASKALINTVDHLGTVAYKVDSFLDEKVNEISATRLQFSSLEQKLSTCRGFIDGNGLLQQSLVIKIPKHYKHYTIPGSQIIILFNCSFLQNVCPLCPQEDKHITQQDIQETVAKPHPELMRRGHLTPAFAEFSPAPLAFSFVRVTSNQGGGKRTASPFRLSLKRSGSVGNSSASPKSSANKQCPSEPRRAISLTKNPEANRGKEIEVYSRKSKPLLKALLSLHRSRKQGVPHRFRDDK